jgi:leader peptidase (prepilin peptidase)/N-methyltransferase
VADREPVDWSELAAARGLAGWCALTAALAAGSVAWVLGDDPSLPAWIVLCVVGTWLAYIDWRTRLLPRRLVLPTYVVVGVALLVGALASGDTNALVRAGGGWLATFGVYAVLWLIHPRGLGYGDVRLSGVLGMTLGWIGWSALLVGAYAGFLLGAVIGGLLALARVVDRGGYPFGPFMLAGAWLGAVTSPMTVGWF